MKVSRVILSVCLLLIAVQTVEGDGHMGSLNDITFECSKGFSFYRGNCYKAIDVPHTMEIASLVCLGQGSLLYYPEDEIEYHEYVATLLPKKIWFGMYKDESDEWKILGGEVTLDQIPRWGSGQPDLMAGNATAVDPENEVMIYDGTKMLPFVCKYQACLKDYMPCDGKCIPPAQVCNGLPECSDERDENNCPSQGTWYLNLVEKSGSIQTQQLSDFEEQRWILEANVGDRIQLYVPQMNLEENVVFLEIWTGSSLFHYSEMLARFTGESSNKYLYSNNNFMSIRFYSKDITRFVATYTLGWLTDIPNIPGKTEEVTAISTWKSITMPFTSEEYKPKDLMLSWQISANVGQVITYYVRVTPKTGYSMDDVKYKLTADDMELANHHYYTSAGMEVNLMSEYVPLNGDVAVSYKLGCGMDIDDTYGIIVSPHPIPNDLQCSWNLNAGEKMSRGMALKFFELNLEEDPRTNPTVKSEDKFMIYVDGSSEEVAEVSQYNEDVKNIIHAPKGHFKVNFMSDATFMSEGFKLGFGTDCESLEISEETEKNTNMTYFQESVVLTCPTGYKFHMEKYHDPVIKSVKLECDAGSNGNSMWMIDGESPGPIPECQEVYCGPPDKIQNGGIKSATGVTYKKVATYTCIGGFEMKPDPSKPNATCEEDGKWSNVPTCTSSRCLKLNDNMLNNGKFEIFRGNNFTDTNADFDTVVKFSCDEGYELLGPMYSHCSSDGWTHEKETNLACQKISCAVPMIKHSSVPAAGESIKITFGSIYTVTCNSGYSFKSGESTVELNCQSNGTFDKTLSCEDIDECTGSNQCDNPSTDCMNNEGNYICKCKPGFERSNDFICTDIPECVNDEGGCSDTCKELQGSYECQCPTGKVLIESNGHEGFNFPAGESGLRQGDVFYINHTCVPKQCPKLEPVDNGQYLKNSLENFHYEDEVRLQCNNGYQVKGSSAISAVSKCTSEGQWDKISTCEARKCVLPSTPANGEYDKTEVMFGESVKLTCQLTNDDSDKRELNAVCIYLNKDDGVGFVGDEIKVCPEIDCGDPELVLPSGGKFLNNQKPTTTTFLSEQSTFIFDCENGYDVIGNSTDEDGDNVVRCKKNGRWHLGTLACAGKMCKDPGTLGDSMQVFDGYDIGSKLYYTCDRPGFTVLPKNYTCEFTSNQAVWSDSLESTLPECKDTTDPTFAGSCDKTFNVDAVDKVSFDEVKASDNFGLHSMTMTDNIKKDDRIIADTTVVYEAQDFEGNVNSCEVEFKVIDRTQKPTLMCPDSKTVMVTSEDSVPYDYTEDVSVTGGDITSAIPSNIVASVSKIGTMEIVTVRATNEFKTESMCTYMVYFVAGACFKDQLFKDSNAEERECFMAGDDLVCNSTCKTGFMYSDRTTMKQFTCTGSNIWKDNQAPNDRFCLRQKNPEYEVSVVVRHQIGYLSSLCVNEFKSAVTTSENSFESNIFNLCQQSWAILDVTSKLADGLNNMYETSMKLRLESSVSVDEAVECIEEVKKLENGVFNFTNNRLFCASNFRDLTVDTITPSEGSKNCDPGYYLDEEDNCLTYGPAQYFDTNSNSAKDCPSGQYQNELGQTECKECTGTQFPNSDQTGCQETCPSGFFSANGFYPCTPCAPNTYWKDKNNCDPCQSGYSTVDIEGVDTENECYAPCPVGRYSRTGFEVSGCDLCPINFYQDTVGQRTCKECNDDRTTSAAGSISSDNCTQISEDCDRAYCSDKGTCSFKRHRRLCTCDTGYYGDKCEKMYHICDGNPCKNGATCTPGASPTDHTCACNKNFDTCEMEIVNEGKVGSQTYMYDNKQLNLDECKAACLNDANCEEASSIFAGSSFCLLFNRTLQFSELVDRNSDEEVHMKKTCIEAYKGDRCEIDNMDNCVGNDCNENSQCRDKVQSFECICPANGGFSGEKCNDANQPCASNPCGVNGDCVAYGSVRFECTCDDGYTGEKCETNINDCTNNPDACAYNGECVDLVNNYRCNCKPGFEGRYCQNTPNFCSSNDCKGDNVCYNSLVTMEDVCMCETPLFGTRYRCQMDVTENRALKSGTEVARRFVNDIEQCKTVCQDNYKCLYAIFESPDCKMYDETFISETTESSSSEIRKNCVIKPDVGYACDQVKLPCDNVDCNNGECENINGNLDSRCVCNDGYTGSLCQHSVDDCANNLCQNDAECVDDHNSYNCSCKVGFDGNRCENNIDDCPGDCNEDNGRCEDGINEYECICNAGFVGKDCEIDFNECLSNPCKHGGECENLENSFVCDCEKGYVGNMCEDVQNNCAGQRTCENDGECISLQETSFCRCEGGATGERCENATLLCDTLANLQVCLNDGQCVNGDGTATCECETDYDKERCFMEDGMEGKSGGSVTSPKISTVQGSDKFCQEECLKREECTSVTYAVVEDFGSFCQFYTVGEGSITDTDGSTHYKKNCPTDYEGVSCEIVKDWCSQNPCKNKGTCIPMNPDGYSCKCMPGYSGAICEFATDPCENNPCQGRADCRATSLSTYDCLCTEGKPWTGSACRASDTGYTMLVNAADARKSPPSLHTLFPLKTKQLSVMMEMRIHYVNSDIALGTVFALLVTEDVTLPTGTNFNFSLTVSENGIYVRQGLEEAVGISFEEEETFKENLFNGEWHHLGISLTSEGTLLASLDALHVDKETEIKLDLDHNAQISLGYGSITEYTDVEVFDRAFSTREFAKASTGTKPSDVPIQSFRNYNIPPSASVSTTNLSSNIARNPNLILPRLKCDDVDDIYYASSERLVSISTVPNLLETYEEVKKSESDLDYSQTFESTVTWGAYPFIIIGMDKVTKNYGICRSKVVIRYNQNCPDLTEQLGLSVSSRECSATNKYCDIKCNDDSKVFSAPIPYYLTCGTLGVYDFRMPFAETFYPECEAFVAVKYRLTASMNFELQTECDKTATLTLNLIDDKLKENFKGDIKDKWLGICEDIDCSNLMDVTFKCQGASAKYDVIVSFSLHLNSMTLTFASGGSVDIENALKLIIFDLDLTDISGATVKKETVVIKRFLDCPTGNRLDMTRDSPVCVPCSKGYYLKEGECMPCGYGNYTDKLAQTECQMCQDMKITYSRGARSSDECKEKCTAGNFYDKDKNVCAPCERHFYQHEEGKDFCIPCRNEYKTVTEGSDSEGDCKADCPAGEGREDEESPCKICDRGYWRSLTFDDCQKCDDKKTTFLNEHAEDKSDCKMDICELGNYFDKEGDMVCKPCPIGEYQDEELALSCKKCDGNKTTEDEGSASKDKCKFYCPAGYEIKNNDTCVPCERGYFKDNSGNTKFAACSQCPQDTTDMMGATSEDDCKITICKSGQFIDDDKCEDCQADYYSDIELPTSKTECKKCKDSYGTEQAGSMSSQCKRFCQPGTFLNGDDCDECARGYFKDNTGNSRFDNCTKCPNKNNLETITDLTGSKTAEDCSFYKCKAGSVPGENGCELCEVNTYQPDESPLSSDECKPCQPKNGRITNTMNKGASSADQCLPICDAGKYFSDTTCVPCERGTFKENIGEARFGNCTVCTGDKTTESEGADKESLCSLPKCEAGQYFKENVCTNCEPGSYSEIMYPNSKVKCQPCGTVSGVVYGTESDKADNSSLCKPTCPGGQQYNTDTKQCEACPIESFKEDSKRFDMCTLCEDKNPGYVASSTGSTSSDQCTIRNCQPGEQIDGSECKKCPVGTYQDKPRQSDCNECGINLSTDGEGKTSSGDCQIKCGPGLEGTDSCSRCAEGKFKASEGYDLCQDCELDRTSNALRTDCDVFFCSIGKEYNKVGDVESCDKCKVGTFKSAPGNGVRCENCSLGLTTNGTGQGSCDLLNCVPGKYKSGDECVLCKAGSYKSSTGNEECKPCTPGSTTDKVTGATSVGQCDTDVCQKGNYLKEGIKRGCTPCEAGSFQPMTGMRSCEKCPDNKITLEDGQFSEDACVPECKEGQQYNSSTESCFLCPTGTYKSTVGNKDTDICQPCPLEKTTAGQGAKLKSDCSQNKCPPGKYFEVENAMIVCKECPIGKYSDTEMQESCTECPDKKTTQATGTKSEDMCILDCGEGIGYKTNLKVCEPCLNGQYNGKSGNNPNTCKQCPKGKTNYQKGSPSCVFDALQPVADNRINLLFTVTINVAINDCNDVNSIVGIQRQFDIQAKSVFIERTVKRFHGEHKFCSGDNCDNLMSMANPTCNQLTKRKRDITHSLSIQFKLKNINEYITDTADNNSNIPAVEVISQILRLDANLLSDLDKEIIFVGFSNVITEDICEIGQSKSNSVCEPCETGTYGISNEKCDECPLNTYQNMTGQTECNQCPDKTYTENKKSVNESQCIPICQAGYEFEPDTKTCSMCEQGFYKKGEGNENCTKCDTGKTTKGKGSTSTNDCSQTLCQAGEFYEIDEITNAVKCNPCVVGTYNPDVQKEECEKCGVDKTTLGTGKKSIDDCIEKCTPGNGYKKSKGCSACKAGQFNDVSGTYPNNCKFCPDGQTSSAGASVCTPDTQQPVVKRFTVIKIITVYVKISSCNDITAMISFQTSFSVSIRNKFITARTRYSSNLSFCTSANCDNFNLNLPNNGACSLRGAGRRKRQTANGLIHALQFEAEFRNVSDRSVDTNTNTALPTADVIDQIIDDNKDTLSPDPNNLQFASSEAATENVVCGPGQNAVSNLCVDCGTGSYSENGGSCKVCPVDQYQDTAGQSSCKSCPPRTFNDDIEAKEMTKCLSYCVSNPNYCNNRGVCSDTGRRTASCSCYDNYEGSTCASKKEPSSDMPAILGGAIGGGAALLIIILIIVGVFMKCSRDSAVKDRKHKQFHDPEYVQNGAYEGTYDNYGYHGGQVRPVAPYPSIGYPALGYKPDQSFEEEGAYNHAYKYRPSINGDDGHYRDDDTRFVWSA